MCEHHPQQQSLPFCLSTRSDEANCKVAHTGVCVYISLLGHAIRFRGHVVCLVRDRDVRRPVNINCLLPFCFTHTNPAGCQTTTQQGHLPGKARKQKWNYRLMDGIQGRKMMDQWKDKAKLENKKIIIYTQCGRDWSTLHVNPISFVCVCSSPEPRRRRNRIVFSIGGIFN